MEAAKEEATSKSSLADSLRKQNTKLQERLNEQLHQLEETKNSLAVSEEQFNHHSVTQQRLGELYKQAEENYKIKLEELESTVKTLKKTLAAQKKETEEAQAKGHQAVAELHEAQEEIERLKGDEPEHRVRLGDDAEETNLSGSFQDGEGTPGGSRRSLLMRLQRQYEETSRELHRQRQESRSLQLSLEEVLHEVERKAPVLQRQRQEYDRMAASYNSLAQRLQTAERQNEQLRQSVETLTIEKTDLSKDVTGLSRQVQLLLHESGQTDTPPPQAMESEAGLSSDSLTFRSVAELQQRNVMLLQQVRQLGRQVESSARAATNEQLRKALAELETMRESRRQLTDRVTALARQRDMLQSLVASSDPSALPSTPFSPSKTSRTFRDEVSMESSSAMRQLQEEYDTYRSEQHASERKLQDKLDATKEELSHLRVDLAKANTKNDFLNGI